LGQGIERRGGYAIKYRRAADGTGVPGVLALARRFLGKPCVQT